MATIWLEGAKPPLAEGERRIPGWRSGMDLRLFGGGCFFVAVWLSVYAVLWNPDPALFGATIPEFKAAAVWACAEGLLLAIGYGFTFHRPWVWDMTLATFGLVAVGVGLNEAAWGFTLAGTAALFGIGALALYLTWRRDALAAMVETKPARRLDRGRR